MQKERPYIFVELATAFVPIIVYFLWGITAWPGSFSQILNNEADSFVYFIVIGVPLGALGLLGIAMLAIQVASDTGQAYSKARYILVFVFFGMVAAIYSLITVFYKLDLYSIVALAPIAVTIHLLWLGRRGLINGI